MADEGVDAYFGARREHMRWLTGFTLAEGEDKVSGHSGQFLVGPTSRDGAHGLALHDPGAARGAGRRSSTRSATTSRALGRGSSRRTGARRVAIEAAAVSHALWTRLEAAAPDVELVPVDGWLEAMRAIKRPDEVERIAAACAVADRALAALLPEIRAGRDRARRSRSGSSG